MATIGQMQEFRSESESFAAYVERVQLLFFTANDVGGQQEGGCISDGVRRYYVRVAT